MQKIQISKLIEAGVPRAVFWNTDINKEVDEDILLISVFQKGYNDAIIKVLFEFYGKEKFKTYVIKHKYRISKKLYSRLLKVFS